MSRLEDIYMEDDDGANDLERIIEGNNAHNSGNDSDDKNSHSEAEEEAPRRVDPEKAKQVKVIRNPRVVLNPKRLTGPRGIKTIEEFFKDFKFEGKGHEKDDLNMVMKKLEHWAHRLYPKFQFDDCLDKIASLGSKKEVSVYVKRIRMDMIFDDEVVNQSDSENEEGGVVTKTPVLDEFDLLLDQQIALARSTPASIAKTVLQYDDSPDVQSTKAINSPFSTPGFNANIPTTSSMSTPVRQTNSNAQNKNDSGVTEEQRMRMMKNRLLAEERRLARMAKEKSIAEQNSQPEASNFVFIDTQLTPASQNEDM